MRSQRVSCGGLLSKVVFKFIDVGEGPVNMGSMGLAVPIDFQRRVLEPINFRGKFNRKLHFDLEAHINLAILIFQHFFEPIN